MRAVLVAALVLATGAAERLVRDRQEIDALKAALAREKAVHVVRCAAVTRDPPR